MKTQRSFFYSNVEQGGKRVEFPLPTCYNKVLTHRKGEILIDYTSLPAAENTQLQLYRERMKVALQTAGICVFEVDLKNRAYTFFENAEGVFGVCDETVLKDVRAFSEKSSEEFRRETLRYFVHEEDFAVVKELFARAVAGKGTSCHVRLRAAGLPYIWCKLDVSLIEENDRARRVVGAITDINDMYAETEQLERAAMLDDFTDLYAKAPCLELIGKALRSAPDKTHALLMMDLDNFKDVNDTYGHLVGDQVLLSVAKELKGLFRSTDIVGRFGGDEFLVFMQNVKSREAILSKLELVIRASGIPYPVTKSVGIAFYPNDGENLELLLERADMALYRAKRTKCAYVMYSDI